MKGRKSDNEKKVGRGKEEKEKEGEGETAGEKRQKRWTEPEKVEEFREKTNKRGLRE